MRLVTIFDITSMKKILFTALGLASCLSVSAQQKITSGHITFEESKISLYVEGEVKKQQISFKFNEDRARMERRDGEIWNIAIADMKENTVISYGEQNGNRYSSTKKLRPELWSVSKEEMEAEWGRELSNEEYEAFLNSEQSGFTCEIVDTTKVIEGYTCRLMRVYSSSGMEGMDASENRTDYWFTEDIVAPFQVLAEELYQYNMDECELPGLCLEKTVIFFGTELKRTTAIEVVSTDYSGQEDELFNMTVPEGYPNIEEQMEQMMAEAMEEAVEGIDYAMEGLEESMEELEAEFYYSEKLDEDMGYGDFKIFDPYKKHEKYFIKEYPSYEEGGRSHSIDINKAAVTNLHGLSVKRLVAGFAPLRAEGLEADRFSFFCAPDENAFSMLEEIYGVPTSSQLDGDGQVEEAIWYSSNGVTMEFYNGHDFDEETGLRTMHAGEYLVLRFRLNY